MDELQQHRDFITRKVEDEMRDSFLQYALSVIVARALPDVRDGLKPVHRRILHAMNELGLDPNKAYKKSARIVGETMGKYHPHGESSIYDALVRMAQEFSMRYMLVDGHGNFGSLDGDAPAAQRYTEARLAKISVEMLADIDKNTVDFIPNYDEEDTEPTVLPARFPALLVNGSNGIAVGMATNIPPHNLTEAINGCVKIIEDQIEGRETEITDLLAIIKGPDFPTGATILGTAGIKAAYLTGRGRIVVRSDCEIEPMGGGREMIVIKSLPYQVNKARLVEKIAELIKDKKIDGITDLRDESDRHGIRIVAELRKDANSNVILNNLYKFSQVQDTFSVNAVALVNGRPRTLNLLSMLKEYLKHQREVVTRRSRFELEKAQARAHVLQGLIIALDNIDEVINIIRSSQETSEALERLIERFSLTKVQAEAIVDMRLRRLVGLEREKLMAEYEELLKEIERLTAILADEGKLLVVIRDEMLKIKEKYGDERRTKIVPFEEELGLEDLIDDETSVITMTNFDYIKRLPLITYKTQSRGGKGVMGLTTRDEDVIKDLFIADTHDDVLFFTTLGRVYTIKAYAIPEAGRQAKGTAAVNLLQLQGGERVAAVMPVRDYEGYLMFATREGIVKKTALSNFANIRKSGVTAITIREGDEIITVMRTDGGSEVMLCTRNGAGIRFNESDARPLGRTAAGVIGIRLREGDVVVGAAVVGAGRKMLVVSEKGYGKRTETDLFRLQSRGGQGMAVYKISEKTGPLIGAVMAADDEELLLINSEGNVIRIRVEQIRETGRAAGGVRLIRNDEDVTVVSIAKIAAENVERDEEDGDMPL